MSLLFTYGTLMRHQRNHWRLYGSAYRGRAIVRGHLFQFRVHNFPILKLDPAGPIVEGELYEVNRAVLDVQDWYELLYKRVKALAYSPNVKPNVRSCWVYEGLNFLPLEMARRLRTGRWPE